MKHLYRMLPLILGIGILVGCGKSPAPLPTAAEKSSVTATKPASTPAPVKTGSRDTTPKVLEPTADSAVVYDCAECAIDCSNMAEGYFCLKYTGTSDKVRMLVETPKGNTYNYLVALDGEYDVYPFSEGDGGYKIGVYENISGDKYAQVFSQTVDVKMTNEYSAFLYPNAYVDFSKDSNAIGQGKSLAEGADTDLDVVTNVYHWMADNIEYDYDKAATVQSGYLPVVDSTLKTKTGICFDYASLMGAMLRSQGIPTRLEIGYAGEQYHAWIGVYIKDQGWIDDIIVFDGTTWSLMDPTLASYASKSTIKDHWNDRSNYYQLKYKY